jgi:hypothetical protein
MRWFIASMLSVGSLALAAMPFATAKAASVDNPLVLELFTSQGCSSCPPADAYAAELAATRADLLVLDFHVDYWNQLGWHDPFSLRQATERQEGYDGLLNTETYTPQLVIGGSAQAVGSSRPDVEDAISQAEAERRAFAPVPLSLTPHGASLEVRIGAGKGSGSVWLVGYDLHHTTAIGRGENDGLRETEANIVRSIVKIADWSGNTETMTAPRFGGETYAVLLQRPDGAILSAARLSPVGS